MSTHVNRTKRIQSVLGSVSQKNNGDTFQFDDQRPENQRTIQLRTMMGQHRTTASLSLSKKENKTGLPEQLKSRIEQLSGHSMDDVKVHYNSAKPAQLQAHAYAQGTNIHLGVGQEKHLPHEAWHVVQQKQGRVKPTLQLKGKINVNDEAGLEKEADVMGTKALQLPEGDHSHAVFAHKTSKDLVGTSKAVAQRMPKDFGRMGENPIGKEIIIRYNSGSAWIKLEGKIEKLDDNTLIIQGKSFTRAEVNGDQFKIVRMPYSSTGATDKDIDAHRPADPWTELATMGGASSSAKPLDQKGELLVLVQQVVTLAETMPTALQSLMPHDDVYNMTPEGQLEYCVNICKTDDAGVLAKSLYTSYFYKPINTFLRGQLPQSVDKTIVMLIEKVLAVLEITVKDHEVLKEINNQRVELQAEWMGDPQVGSFLDFPGLTSLHPTGGGIESMKEDIGNGLFGDVTKIAVLNFKGQSKTLVPIKKYFDNEKEVILPPGIRAKVTDVKDITVVIPKKGSIPGKEYTLEIMDPK